MIQSDLLLELLPLAIINLHSQQIKVAIMQLASRSVLTLLCALMVFSELSCKVVDRTKSFSDKTINDAVDSSNHDSKSNYQSIPANGSLIAEYTSLGSIEALRSVSYPSSNPISRLSEIKGETKTPTLALYSGAPTNGTILQSIGSDFAQIRSGGTNEVFLTIDGDGNFAIVMYVNAEIGYFFPSNGDLANCFQVTAPINSKTLPFVDCVDIGSATSIIDDGTKYSTGQTLRSGSTIYYKDGQRLSSGGSTVYYANGEYVRNGSYYYWQNGNEMIGYGIYYPSGKKLYSSSTLYFWNEEAVASSGYGYYLTSNYYKRSGSTYSYPDGDRLMSSGGSIYYPNGEWLRDSYGNLQTADKVGNQQQIFYETSQSGADFRINARGTAVWLGIIESYSTSSFSAYVMSHKGIGATLGSSSPTLTTPPSPINVQIKAKTSTSLTLDWQSDGGTTSKYLVKRILNPSTFIPTCVGGTEVTVSEYTFSSLTSGAPYAFLVCSVNSQDVQSPAIVVLAMAGQPLPPPLDLRLSVNPDLTTDASWSLVDNASAVFRLRVTESPEVPVNCSEGYQTGTGTSYRVTNLDENAVYFVGVCSQASTGVLSTPAIQRIKTPAVPPPQVSAVTSESKMPKEVILSWKSGGLHTNRFLIEYAEGANVSPPACTAKSNAFTSASALIGGLKAGVPYTFRICAESRRGTINSGVLLTSSSLPVALDGLHFAAGVGSINHSGSNVLNPMTNSTSCPDGYSAYQFIGTTGVDYPAFICYSRRNGDSETAYDFGGAIGNIELSAVANPVNGLSTCPSGYSEQTLLNSPGIDASLKICYRTHRPGVNSDVLFGGIFGKVQGVPIVNPATGEQSCPPGFLKSAVYGTSVKSPKDADVFVCHKTITTPPTNVTNIVAGPSEYSSARFTWSQEGSGVTGYIVAFASGSTPPATCEGGVSIGNVTSYTAPNLSPNQTYSFRICSKNEFLGMSSGSTITLTTSSSPGAYIFSYDFGGAYGSTGNQAFNVINPATGSRKSCPAGYSEFIFNENTGNDFPAAVCQRPGSSSQETFLDFGGMIGMQGGSSLPNPVTGAPNCPQGYSELEVLSTAKIDYSLKFCYRAHVAGRSPDVLFGGVYGYRNGVAINNPITGTTNCPDSYTKTRVWGSPAASGILKDFDIFMCHRTIAKAPVDSSSPPAVSNITSGSATLNWSRSSDFASGYLISYIAGDAMPSTCSGAQSVGDVTTFNLSGLKPSTKYSFRICAVNSLGAISTGVGSSFTTLVAPPAPEVSLDFGGAYGSTSNKAYNVINPATGRARTCPAGYGEFIFVDNTGADFPAAVCQRTRIAGQETFFDFGGMFGVQGSSSLPNPVTGSASCPVGYTALEVLSTTKIDYSLKVCFRNHVAGTSPEFLFGGVFGYRGGVLVNNPLTGNSECPAGFIKSRVWGSPAATGKAKDFDVFMCHKAVK